MSHAYRVLSPSPETAPGPNAEEVEAFLRAHPAFLTERPDLYRVLTPPRRVHGETLTDHMVAMIAAERSRRRVVEGEILAALEAGRAGSGLTIRVRLAVLALIRARGEVMEVVTQEIPALLGVETATLAAEPGPDRRYLPAGVLPLPAGAVSRLVGRGREAVVRTAPTELDMLHAEAAPLVTRDALARVPLTVGPPMLIALGARDAASLPVRQAAPVLAFLGRAVAAALAR